MTQKAFTVFAAIGVGWLLATVFYPVTMLVVKCFDAAPSVQGMTPEVSISFPMSLFLRSVGLAAMGATVACVAAIPGIFLVGRTTGPSRSGIILGLLLAPLVFPPMVAALGLRSWIPGSGMMRCIGVWTAWCWPIASFIVGGAWAKRGHRLYEVALINGSRLRAFLCVLTSVLIRPICAVWTLLFAVFLGDYSVPHACDMMVYATVLLTEATSSPYPVGTVKAGLPLLAPMLVAISIAYVVGLRGEPSDNEEPAPMRSDTPRLALAVVVLMVAVSVILPVIGLMRRVELGAAINQTWQLYGADVVYSLGTALLAGVIIIWMGVCVALWSPIRRIAPLVVLVWAVVPGALIGEAVVAAYLPFDFVYSHWMLTVIGYVARFGWMGVLCAYLVVLQSDSAAVGAALVDGASSGVATWRVTIAGHWPTLAGGVLIAASMSLAEVATTALVRVPIFTPVSLILIEKFHRFEDDILVALCILLLIGACPGIVLVTIARRWHR